MGAEEAAALKLQMDGQEIAALIIENWTEAATREGRDLHPGDLVSALAPLLAAAWAIAQRGCPGDLATARALYVDFLRRHADGVEGLHAPDG